MTVLNITKEDARVIASIAKASNQAKQSSAANPCKGCKAMYHDTAPADVFDRIQEQSRATLRAQCELVADGAKPCMQAAQERKSQPSLRSLAIEAQDAAGELGNLLQANTALEWLVANAPAHGMPRPEDLGALLNIVNGGVATRLAALESALGALRAAV